jgi:hypothetical protein
MRRFLTRVDLGSTWAKLSITVERSDGGIVDAEIIRPRSWILESGLCAGRMLPLNLPELEVSGLALVTAIDDCPPIACGEGSVVTARFVTREVQVVVSVDVLGADGTVETITGTTIHPVWSVDRQEWVPLAELAEGERLQGLDGLAVVLGISLSRVSQAVYNIEVHGEHVYQVGELGLVVHNVSRSGWGAFGWGKKLKAPDTAIASLPAKVTLHKFASQTVEQILKAKKGSIKNAELPVGSPSWSSIMKMSWEQIEAAAKAKQPGFQTIKKLLTDGRFDR